MQSNFGATYRDWMHFAEKLKLRGDLLPVVSNPDAPIAEYSKLADRGKVPSRYNSERQIQGIPRWTQVNADARDVQRWAREPDYGICIQTRLIRAIDVDVTDPAIASAIEQTIRDAVPGVHFPLRSRANSSKLLMPFLFDGELAKRSFPVGADRVELLATGQQFVAIGLHPSGYRYQWQDGLPEGFPVLDSGEVEEIWSTLEMLYATGASFSARVRQGAGSSSAGEDTDTAGDEILRYLTEHGLILDEGAADQVYIECPWCSQHTSDSGVTQTAYFPAGTGGYELGHFKCLHDHCSGRTDEEFLEAIGFTGDYEFRAADFPDLSAGSGLAVPEHRLPGVPGLEDGASLALSIPRAGKLPAYAHLDHAPIFKRKATGNGPAEIIVSQDNVAKAFECAEFTTRKLRYDTFLAEPVWAWWDEAEGGELWRPWADVDNARAMRTLDVRGFKSTPGVDMVRRAVDDVARQRPIDTAINWLQSCAWDGVPRVERFMIDYLGCEDTPYARAVGRYLWTALAGRCLRPGIKADMALILVTPEQGRGKTSMIEAIVPDEEWFGELDLSLDDADLGRIMKGKLVCELSELKGLSGRDRESIKAFISRRKDEWTPKYQEKAQPFFRRCVFIGTTNEEEFLADPSGERRWLPIRIGRAIIDAIRADREKLWAEGCAMYLADGIAWRDAEVLAAAEHENFKRADPLEDKIAVWLHTEQLGGYRPADRDWLTIEEIAEQCLQKPIATLSVGDQRRLGEILRVLGYRRSAKRIDGVPRKVWFKLEKTECESI